MPPAAQSRSANTPSSHPGQETEDKQIAADSKPDTTTAQTEAPTASQANGATADVSKTDAAAPATTATDSESKTDTKAEKEAEKEAEKKVEKKVEEPAPVAAPVAATEKDTVQKTANTADAVKTTEDKGKT